MLPGSALAQPSSAAAAVAPAVGVGCISSCGLQKCVKSPIQDSQIRPSASVYCGHQAKCLDLAADEVGMSAGGVSMTHWG